VARVELVVGTPAWDRAWALPLWFDSVRANVDPERTGLAFVVPASDASTREAIAGLSEGFAWVEILRDRGDQSGREERAATKFTTLAHARNMLLQVVNRVRPEHYISWDTDFLIEARGLEALIDKGLPLVTPWAWLNRQPPKRIRHFDGRDYHEVYWQPPVCATAMGWDPSVVGRPYHYSASEFQKRRMSGTWECGVALAFQVMDQRAYAYSSYSPHYDGEDVPFNWRLAQRGVPRHACGDVRAVHLYDRNARDEIAMGWPQVMNLADELPLASWWTEPRSREYTAFGFFPTVDGADIRAA
jgi:hypothetical protein